MNQGIETTRPILDIDAVNEHHISKQRLLMLRDQDEAGIREGERLYQAECKLIDAVQNYLKRGATPELVHKIIEQAIEDNRKDIQ